MVPTQQKNSHFPNHSTLDWVAVFWLLLW
jgi:hypothetical protein